MIRPWDETSHPPQWRLAAAVAWSMEVRMVKRSPLDNRDTSNVAWARYRRLMKGMALVSLLAVVGALGWLRFTMGEALTRSEEHTSELPSLMRISYAVFCLQKKK